MAHRKYSSHNVPFSVVNRKTGKAMPSETKRIQRNNNASAMSELTEKGVGGSQLLGKYSPRAAISRGVNRIIGVVGGDATRNIRHGINIAKKRKKK